MKMKGKIMILPLLAFILLLGCSKTTEDKRNQSDTVTDIEGNVYKTVHT